MTANAQGAGYEWLDCDDSMNGVVGATNREFTTFTVGNYAVEITQNNCVDTTDCFAVSIITGQSKSVTDANFTIYPNPSSGKYYLNGASSFQEWSAYSLLGTKVGSGTSTTVDLSEYDNGVYFINIPPTPPPYRGPPDLASSDYKV